jgi:hypothetical protein
MARQKLLLLNVPAFLITSFCVLTSPLILSAQITVVAEQTKAHEESKQKAEVLWAEAVVAKGGRERLYQVNSLVISYQETARNLLGFVVHRGLVERLYVFPGKSWSWDDGLPPPFHVTVSMYNLERNSSCTMHAGASSQNA